MPSSLARIVEDAARETWPGNPVRLSLAYTGRRRAVAWLHHTTAEGEAVLAAAGGADSGEALRGLLACVYREDRNLTTQEAAAILGTQDGPVRVAAGRGTLQPVEHGRRPLRFRPEDVLRRAGVLGDIKEARHG